MPDDAQVCSCNNVSKGQICDAIREQEPDRRSARSRRAPRPAPAAAAACRWSPTCSRPRSRRPARRSTTHLCEHFACTPPGALRDRQDQAASRRSTSCSRSHGRGHGCEICKPAVASILASLWNENVVEHTTLQDTNDRFLANIQRGGTYSVVPRVPGGEITPEKLIVLGQVAKKYGLYTKITGGQRIDLFGAPRRSSCPTSGKSWSTPASRAATPTARRCAP